jgi:energy-coupling factor transport system substrate-specific component
MYSLTDKLHPSQGCSFFIKKEEFMLKEFSCGPERIAGCRFAIYPMSDDFVNLILSAIEKVDTSKVWIETDDITTCVRGRISHVFDVTKAIFLQVAKTGTHSVLNATYSIGCPGDTAGDVFLAENDVKKNEPSMLSISQKSACHFALYPLGQEQYIETIMNEVEVAKKEGTLSGGVHYASRLDGDCHDIFQTLEGVFTRTQLKVSHVVMTATVSANSPTKKA